MRLLWPARTKALRKQLIVIAAVLAAYAILIVSFSNLSPNRGLITPEQSPDWGLMIFGGLLVVMRLGVLFVMPPIVIYRVLRRLLLSISPEDGSAQTSADTNPDGPVHRGP
jgi:ABC-type dipeptide/oligopeptide/nickel transport system permease subunit